MNSIPSKSKPQEVRRNLYGSAFCIVAARFNSDIVEKLTASACQTLLDNGAPGIHFYTMNQVEPTREIYNNLGI